MIAGILGILSAIGFIVKFVKDFIAKYLVHSVIISAQFAITASTIVFVILFYTFTITSLVTLYNKGLEIFDYASNSGLQSLACFAHLVDCIGLASALENGFTLFYASLSTIVIFHLFKFTFHAMKIIMNEVFKLGLLLGQAV